MIIINATITQIGHKNKTVWERKRERLGTNFW